MTIRILLAGGLMLAGIGTAVAQGAHDDNAGSGDAGVRSGNITSTGETVPNPGASQSAGTTSMDKGIQSRDNKIDSGICKGC